MVTIEEIFAVDSVSCLFIVVICNYAYFSLYLLAILHVKRSIIVRIMVLYTPDPVQ